jgi:hypothetical protein
MAPRIFFLFNILILIYFFKYETIMTHARAFLTLNILTIGRVQRLLISLTMTWFSEHKIWFHKKLSQKLLNVSNKELTYRVYMIRQPMSTKHQSDNEQNLRGFSVLPYCHISTIWMAKWGSCLSSLTNNPNYLSMSDKNHGNGYNVLKKR